MFEIYSEARTPLMEFMELSLDERKAHLRLDQPCVEIGTDSRGNRALLAMYLNTSCEGLGMKTGYLCHACGNAKCNNPEHLYWGTSKENTADRLLHNPGLGKRIAEKNKATDPDFYKKLGALGSTKGISKSEKHKKAISDSIQKWHDSRV